MQVSGHQLVSVPINASMYHTVVANMQSNENNQVQVKRNGSSCITVQKKKKNFRLFPRNYLQIIFFCWSVTIFFTILHILYRPFRIFCPLRCFFSSPDFHHYITNWKVLGTPIQISGVSGGGMLLKQEPSETKAISMSPDSISNSQVTRQCIKDAENYLKSYNKSFYMNFKRKNMS